MNKKIILLLLILVSICAVSNVSAADNSTDIETQIDENFDISLETSEIVDDSLDEEASDFRNIQMLIDNADKGDTIYLNGTYVCDYLINVNKTVNIVGSDEAVIKLSDEYQEYNTPFFTVNASNVEIKNLKFVGGLFIYGGAITWKGDYGRITNCEFSDNIANSPVYGIGGALLLDGYKCTLENCIFNNNFAYQYGGAVLWYGDEGRISNCKFTNNKASGNKGWGGALMLYADNCTVTNCIFTNNSCTDYGGAIATHNFTNKIVSCHFEDNYVTNSWRDDDMQGGGAIFSTCVGLVIDNCNFTNNQASNALGGALNLGINNSVVRSYFKGNDALLGNDILASYSSQIQFNHIVLDFNETKTQSIYGKTEDELVNLYNTFQITKVNSTVTFSAGMVFYYAQSGSIGVTVEGGTLELENIRVINHTEANITFNNSLLVVSGLAVGEYILRVTTTPDENHNAVDGDLAITVKKSTATIKASKVTVALKKGTYWTITLIDSKTKKPIPKMKLTLKVYTGKSYKTVSVTTNSKGVASYQTKSLTQGTHKVVVSGTHSGYTFNTLTSSISVIKPTPITFKVTKKTAKDGATLSITVYKKSTKKPINGVKVKLLIYTGKTYKTVVLKSKTKSGYKGVCGYGTNILSVGTHKVVIMPVDIKYSGKTTSKMVIKSTAKKYPAWTHKT